MVLPRWGQIMFATMEDLGALTAINAIRLQHLLISMINPSVLKTADLITIAVL